MTPTTTSDDAAADGAFGGTSPTLGDPADRVMTNKRVGNWPVSRWIEYLDRNPDACLPSGVGAAIVEHLRRS